MSKTRAVFDTSPLIFLDKLEYIPAIQTLFDVFVPPMVLKELAEQPNEAGGRLPLDALTIAEPNVTSLTASESLNLDAGETAAIALALDFSSVVVLDDADARKRARALGLSVVGTIGLLLRLEQTSRTTRSLAKDLDRLIAGGMWISQSMIEKLTTQTNS